MILLNEDNYRWANDIEGFEFTSALSLPPISERVDMAAMKDHYARADAQLGAALTTAMKRLIAELTPKQVQVNPRIVRDLKTPERWRQATVQEARALLVKSWQAGAASAQADLQRARVNHVLSPQTLPEYIDTLAYNLADSLGADAVDTLRALWARALAEDWSVGTLQDKLSEALAGYVDPDGSTVTPARLATIVRTTNTNAFNQARQQVFEDPSLNGFVQAYEYSAILDDRTTALCEYLDGRIYPVDDPFWEEFMPPNHFNCRSLVIPIVEGDEWESSNPPKASAQPQAGFHVHA